MKVSVVTVSYNSAATIGDTLRSVAEQTWPDVEHIVVDGASTDESVRIVKESRRSVARLISEPDEGIYDAMNKGVSAATGEVIGFLNADDEYANETVLSRVAEIFMEGKLDAVLGDVEVFRDSSMSRPVRRYRSDRFNPARIGWGWMPAHPALFVRREMFEHAGGFKTDYRIAGDFEWIARAFTREPVRYRHIPDVLVKMRMGGVSSAGWRSTLRLNREVIRACRENGVKTSWLRILSKYPAKVLEFIGV